MTQEELANQLHVTRQTISRWENNLSYPNLDTLVELSDQLDLNLDDLLKGDQQVMVKEISSKVRDAKRYKRILITITGVLVIILVWLTILGIGRAKQIAVIDRFNPFLETKIGYATLPNKVSYKAGKATLQGTKKTIKIKVAQPVDAYVTSDPFGKVNSLMFQSKILIKALLSGSTTLILKSGQSVK